MDEVNEVIDCGLSIGCRNLPIQKEVREEEVIWQNVFQTI
jgi:hypothetical protein